MSYIEHTLAVAMSRLQLPDSNILASIELGSEVRVALQQINSVVIIIIMKLQKIDNHCAARSTLPFSKLESESLKCRSTGKQEPIQCRHAYLLHNHVATQLQHVMYLLSYREPLSSQTTMDPPLSDLPSGSKYLAAHVQPDPVVPGRCIRGGDK